MHAVRPLTTSAPTPGERRGHGIRFGRLTIHFSDRTIHWILLAITLTPVFIAAIRAGAHGWVPTFDAAHTVLASKYSIGRDPTLVGMFTDASNWIDDPVYFPGPWQLWWMAVPIRVLGVTWGPLLSTATLNALWIALAAWAVRLRFGTRAANWSLVAMAALLWGLGNALFHSPTPMMMIIAPFTALLFLGWCVASGENRALWAFALVANFCLLEHLVLIRVVPPIAAAVLVMWLVGIVRDTRRARSPAHGARRAVFLAALVTIVMWIPPVVQEFTRSPGNLTNLWRAGRAAPEGIVLWSRAATSLAGLIGTPPFWLRGSRDRNLLIYGPQPATLTAIGVGMVVVPLALIVGVLAIRRRDRPATVAVGLAGVVSVVCWYNLAHPPAVGTLGWSLGYYLSCWPSMMFVTVMLAYATLRAVPGRHRSTNLPLVVFAVVALGIANVPAANFTSGTYESTDGMITAAAAIGPEVVDALHGRGMVELAPRDMFSSPYVAAAGVALDSADIPFCSTNVSQWSNVPVADCRGVQPAVVIHFRRTAFWEPTPEETVIATHDPLSKAEHTELRELGGTIRSAIAAAPPLRLTDEARRTIAGSVPVGRPSDDLLRPDFLTRSGGPLVEVTDRSRFANLLHGFARQSGGAVAVRVPGIPDDDLLRWAKLESDLDGYSITVTASEP